MKHFDRNFYLLPSTFFSYTDKNVLTDVPVVNNFQEYFHAHKYSWGAKCYISKNNLCKCTNLYCRQNYQGTELSIMVLSSSLFWNQFIHFTGIFAEAWKALLMELSKESDRLVFPVLLKNLRSSCIPRNIRDN